MTPESQTRRRAGMYSSVRAMALAMLAPMPMPVISRQITKSVRLCDKDVQRVAIPAAVSATVITGLRPMRSPSGAMRPAPRPMPARAAVKATLNLAGAAPHRADTDGTASAMTWMS